MAGETGKTKSRSRSRSDSRTESGPDAQPQARAATPHGRVDEAEFLSQVLAELNELPPQLPSRLLALVAESEERAAKIRQLFEEMAGG